MTLFSFNLNKIALIRNSREGNYPDLMQFAQHVLSLGVQGLTVHPRPDERHIRYADLAPLKALCCQKGALLNVEGYPSDRFLQAVKENRPDQVTLVPDQTSQLTSDHGWDRLDDWTDLQSALDSLRAWQIKTSLFWGLGSLERLQGLPIDAIELYTGPYASEKDPERLSALLSQYRSVYSKGKKMGLNVHAGHDLSLQNLARFLAHCPVDEVSIGHSATVESLMQGIAAVMIQYLQICAGTEASSD